MEIWKPIKDYEGIYEISDMGNTKGLDRKVYDKHNKRFQFIKGRIIKPQINKSNGYLQVHLRKNGERKAFYTHKLVALSFIENINNEGYVNHIDGNIEHNYDYNLEWCSASKNLKHAYDINKRPINKPSVHKMPVVIFNINTNEEFNSESLEQAYRDTSVSPTQIRRLLENGNTSKSGFKIFYLFNLLFPP